jgi:hypothetical protein
MVTVRRVAPGECEAWGILAELEAAGIVTLADKGYQGSTWAKIPYKGKGKPESQKEANRAHARLRGPASARTRSSRRGRSCASSAWCPRRASKLGRVAQGNFPWAPTDPGVTVSLSPGSSCSHQLAPVTHCQCGRAGRAPRLVEPAVVGHPAPDDGADPSPDETRLVHAHLPPPGDRREQGPGTSACLNCPFGACLSRMHRNSAPSNSALDRPRRGQRFGRR